MRRLWSLAFSMANVALNRPVRVLGPIGVMASVALAALVALVLEPAHVTPMVSGSTWVLATTGEPVRVELVPNTRPAPSVEAPAQAPTKAPAKPPPRRSFGGCKDGGIKGP